MTTQAATYDPQEAAIDELINASYVALDSLSKDLSRERNAITGATLGRLEIALRLRSAIDEAKRVCRCT